MPALALSLGTPALIAIWTRTGTLQRDMIVDEV